MTRACLLCVFFCAAARAASPTQAVDPLGRPEARSLTQAQVEVLNRLIDATPDTSPEKPDLLFRRAETYSEEARHYQALGDETKRERWRLAAVKEFIGLVDKPAYAGYRRLDEVLFYLAYELTQMHREDLARNYFKRLIKDYPSSKFIPDSYLAFGEYFFEQNDCVNALKFYDKVLQYPQSRVFGFARYKQGWCWFNLADYNQAVAAFTEVARGDGNATLRREARRDLVRAYAHGTGRPTDALALFREIAGDEAPTLLRLLAGQYHGLNRDADCRAIARDVTALDPGGEDLCR